MTSYIQWHTLSLRDAHICFHPLKCRSWGLTRTSPQQQVQFPWIARKCHTGNVVFWERWFKSVIRVYFLSFSLSLAQILPQKQSNSLILSPTILRDDVYYVIRPLIGNIHRFVYIFNKHNTLYTDSDDSLSCLSSNFTTPIIYVFIHGTCLCFHLDVHFH